MFVAEALSKTEYDFLLLNPKDLFAKERIMSSSDKLTPREWTILELLANGQHNKEIARTLQISEGTVEQHLHHVYQKLDISNRTEACIWFTGHKLNEKKGRYLI